MTASPPPSPSLRAKRGNPGVLADESEGWKPDRYGFEVLGCRHSLEFPVVKLLDYAERVDQLENDHNPFVLVTAAHLRNRQTKHDPEARYQAKRTLVRLLYRQGWERQRILDLFAVLDWMMRLPEGLEDKLWQDIEQIERERKMPYVTSVERRATERGMQQGIRQGMQQGMQQGEEKVLERLLARRFGPLSEATRRQLKNATLEQLESWTDNILDAATLEDVFKD